MFIQWCGGHTLPGKLMYNIPLDPILSFAPLSAAVLRHVQRSIYLAIHDAPRRENGSSLCPTLAQYRF